MKNFVFAFVIYLSAVSAASAQYYGSYEWANDMMNYTNMAMFINTNTINMLSQQSQEAARRKSSGQKTTAAKAKPATFQHTGKQLFLSKVKANVKNTEEEQKAYKIYSNLMQESLKRYEAYVRTQKMNPYDVGLAIAMFVETTYALSHDKHMEDAQVLSLSQEINGKLNQDTQFQKTTNEQRQLMYELFLGPQLVNYVIYEQSKKENDPKTAAMMKQQGLALYKQLMGSEFN